jgi:hypothetical protein
MLFHLHGARRAGAFASLALAFALLIAPCAASAGHIDLSGHVTLHMTGQAVEGLRLSITEPTSPFTEIEIGSATTDAEGFYAWSGDCDSNWYCNVNLVDPPYMPAGFTFGPNDGTVVADFALTLPATASGTVRFPGGDASATAIVAQQYSAELDEWVEVSSAGVGSDGRFTIDRLTPGPYRFCTDVYSVGNVRQCFDHVDFPPTVGDPDATLVDIAEGSARDGIDFDLATGGTVSGAVMDGYLGVPLNEWTTVDVFDVNGLTYATTYTDFDGSFRIGGLPDGTYYVGIDIGAPYRDGVQYYPGVVCDETACPPPTAGAPLTIAHGSAIENLDFTVHPAVVVEGRVVDADSGDPIGNADVFDDGPGEPEQSTSDYLTGEYRLYIAADTPVRIYAYGPSPYVDLIYPAASCIDFHCVGDATPFTVPSGTVLTGIDLEMMAGAMLTGTIADADTGEPGFADITLYDADFNVIWEGPSDYGRFTTPPWLAGTYYVQAIGTDLVAGCAFYEGRPCPADGGDPGSVDPTAIVVAAGELRDGIDFRLAQPDAIFASGFE